MNVDKSTTISVTVRFLTQLRKMKKELYKYNVTSQI
jgi:hypothetical protein